MLDSLPKISHSNTRRHRRITVKVLKAVSDDLPESFLQRFQVHVTILGLEFNTRSAAAV